MFGPEEEMFGKDRLMEALEESRGIPLGEWLDILSVSVLTWSGQEKYDDDLSLLAIEAQ
jgi:serine phosphatase RsbU (regulator of sigma subunit)